MNAPVLNFQIGNMNEGLTGMVFDMKNEEAKTPPFEGRFLPHVSPSARWSGLWQKKSINRTTLRRAWPCLWNLVSGQSVGRVNQMRVEMRVARENLVFSLAGRRTRRAPHFLNGWERIISSEEQESGFPEWLVN